MRSAMHRRIRLLLVVAGITCSIPVLAQYTFTKVNPDGALFTQVFGVNNSGQAVGVSVTATEEFNFIYDLTKGKLTRLSPHSDPSTLLGINDPGVTVGSTDDGTNDGASESGLIRSKDGGYATFACNDWENTVARGVGGTGLVTGYSYHVDTSEHNPAKWTIDASTGFIYDPTSGTCTEYLYSENSIGAPTIPQGINGRGEVVGSVVLEGTDAPAGNGTYAFLRKASGAIILFRVNGRPARARGINDSGLITGFVNSPNGPKGFVVSLADGPAYQNIAVAEADLFSVPFAGATAIFPQGITNAGIITGSWEEFLGGNPSKPANYTQRGFVATPVVAPKNK